MNIAKFRKCPEIVGLRYFGYDYSNEEPMDPDYKAYYADTITKIVGLAEECNVTLYGLINGSQFRKIAALRPYVITERTSINPMHESRIRVVLFTQHDPSRGKPKAMTLKSIVATGFDRYGVYTYDVSQLTLGCCGARTKVLNPERAISWEKALALKHNAKRGNISIGYTQEHGLLFQFPSDKVPFYVRK